MTREGVYSTLDGNAAGGLLREVFAFDATAARTTCAGCARIVPMGELHLYAIDLGAILRCPSCDEAVVRIARTPGGLWLDLRGATVVVWPREYLSLEPAEQPASAAVAAQRGMQT
jgi:hypothetical protein